MLDIPPISDGANRTPRQSKVLLSRADLKALGIIVSDTTLLRWEYDKRFPRRVRLAGTSVAWIAAEVHAWLAERAEERARHVYADPH